MKKLRIIFESLLLLSLPLSTVSCGPNYACKDTLGGFRCETPSEVYQKLMWGDKKGQVSVWSGPGADNDLPDKKGVGGQRVEGSGIASQMEFKEERRPIRIQPKVVRLWLAPWEDSEGDLHMGGFIYAEVAGKRRWALGEKILDIDSRTEPKLMSPLLPGKNEDVNEPSDSKNKGKDKGDRSEKVKTLRERPVRTNDKPGGPAAPLLDRGR